ncbi:heparinase II/III domain-containing protein [Isoptericola rhizosphaerae]|uniref:heparinase II/III domain-containing protein n=1 Tax=Isoptericola rhizosphaerae TaxID=3377837 RepID=UPI003839EEE1
MNPQIEKALEVSARQSQGEGFNRMASDKKVVDLLLGGSLSLPPHPAWDIPQKIRWDADPFGEVNWQAQFNMLRWLDPLRRQADVNEAAREMWLAVVLDWIDANLDSPLTKWGTEGMVAGIRGLAILNGLALAKDPSILVRALERHVEWLVDESRRGVGNHALWQIESLFVLSSALGKEQERAVAIERFEQHVELEYDEEGVNAEGSLAYHLYNYRMTLDALRRFELEGVDVASARERLQGAVREMVHGTRPDGLLERIGDTERASLRGISSPEIDYLRSGGEKGEPPQELTALFGAGYAFGRTGWGETKRSLVDETFYSLRFGRADRVHGHQDGASLTYFARGGPVLIDTGKYGYNRSEMRRHINSRQAHNVVDLQQSVYSKTSDVRLVASESTDSFDSYSLVDEGYHGHQVVREVVFSRTAEWLLVADEVSGSSAVPAISRWHFDAELDVTIEGSSALLRRGLATAAPDIVVAWANANRADVVAGEENPYEGWSATGWNTAVPVPVLRLDVPVGGGRCVTLIAPGDDGVPEIAVEEGADAALVSVTTSSRQWWVVLCAGRAPALFDSRPTHWDEAGHDDQARRTHAQVPPEAMGEVEQILTDARGSLGHDHMVERLREAGSRLRELGLGGGRDYGFGSVVADAGIRVDGFEPRRRSVMPPEFRYRENATYQVFRHGDLPAELPAETAVHVFEIGPVALTGMLVPQQGDVLFVALSGAVDRGRTSLPLFQGLGAHADLPGSSLFFSDPTLELDADLRLGWYLGTSQIDLHAVIASIVERAASLLGAGRIVLVGGSGGGFAALQIAAHLSGATVVAFSPQTSINRYHPRFRDHALRAVFGPLGPSTGDLERLDVTSRYSRDRIRANVHYIQNTGDVFHVDNHVRPFLDALARSPLEGRFQYEEVSMGKGHTSPARDVYVRALMAASDAS